MYKARSKRMMNNTILLFEGLEGLEFIVFDTETTGLDKKVDYVVQLSAIKYKVTNHVMEEIDTLNLYMKPPFYMEQKVIDVHKITNEFLEDKPTEKEVIEDITGFFGEKPVIVGYNSSFDIGMMEAMYKRCNKTFGFTVHLDVLQMARDLVNPDDTKDYKLGTITGLYGLDDGITFHDSMMDVKATARLLNVFYNEYKKSSSDVPLKTLYVNYMYFWKGFNKSQKGLYVDTNMGKIWYCTFNKYWCSTAVDLSTVDLAKLEKGILAKTGMTYDELDKISEAKFDKLKSEGKI